jgi:hypothetical protein
MPTRALTVDDASWARFFDSIAQERDRFLAAVTHAHNGTVPALELSRPLRGISYNGSTDEIEVTVGRGRNEGTVLRYFLSAPRLVQVEDHGSAKLIHVEDVSGLRAMIHLFDRGRRGRRPRDRCAGQ